MRALIASVVVAASVLAGADEAVGYSGNELWADCQNQKPVTTAEYAIDASCTSYIKAVADVMSGGDSVSSRRACFSSGITVGQTRDVVAKWLKANPQHRHYTAHSIVAGVLSDAFPCR